ncbi:MAG: transposase [Ruminococcus sp.]|nr:transposase [Ruminococcus sp.]
MEKRYQNVRVSAYVIMPDHIHIIFKILGDKVGASPHPTLIDVVRTYKSIVTRICNAAAGKQGRKIFQRSFYDTVIWNEEQLRKAAEYISHNPDRWAADIERFGKNKFLYIKE